MQALQLQAVPTVIGVIGGQIAPLFQGVLPKMRCRPHRRVDQGRGRQRHGRTRRTGRHGSLPPEAEEAERPGHRPRFAAADAALERGDFAAASEEFDKLLQASPNDAEAKAGKAQADLLARTACSTRMPCSPRPTAADDLQAQLDAADIELLIGQPDLAFARLIGLIRDRTGAERDQARLRLLELFETLGNSDERVLKARRDLMTALF